MVRTRSSYAAEAGCPVNSSFAIQKKKKAKKATSKKRTPKSKTLIAFAPFGRLPIELRAMVWNLTLKPRAIELEFDEERGFFTRVRVPVALHVCSDSRTAVKHNYPTCFGNFLYQPTTLFNFSMDTLFLHNDIQNHVMALLGGLRPDEASQLMYLAVADDINEDWETGTYCDADAIGAVKKALPLLKSLKEISVVHDLDLMSETTYFASTISGYGPMQLYGAWPKVVMDVHVAEMMDHCSCGHCFMTDEDDEDCGCGLHALPPPNEYHDIVKGLKVTSTWGWRPLPPHRLL